MYASVILLLSSLAFSSFLKKRRMGAAHAPRNVPIPPPPPSEDDLASSRSSRPSIRVVKNDYNQHFVDTGERPQNFIRDHDPQLRFSEYPKLERLVRLKDAQNKKWAHPPVHMTADLKNFDLTDLGVKFDVILLDPPWQEYAERLGFLGGVVAEDVTPWSREELLRHLKIDDIAETPSFCFLWCGSQHLDDGRHLLQAWGFRRCEDICWLKTNRYQHKTKAGPSLAFLREDGLFQRTKEHCLMGVKGVVRRSVDTNFIHSNVDTDVIVEEEPTDSQGRPSASTVKPTELYNIIERFCLGRRKLELFGLDRNLRPGWLTIGKEISSTHYYRDRYIHWTSSKDDGDTLEEEAVPRGRYTPATPEIELLRPKSPPRSSAQSRVVV